jgi:hypothetical protein
MNRSKRLAAGAVLAALMFVAIAPAARAQCSSYTQVTGTVTDPSDVPWAGATLSVDLSTSASATCTGPGGLQVPFSTHFQTQLDPTGSFAIQLPPNSIVTPSGTQWTFSISITVPPPVGRGNQTFVYAGTITGASQDLSSALSALAPEILYGSGSPAIGSQNQIAFFPAPNALGGFPTPLPSVAGAYTCGYFPTTNTSVPPNCPSPGQAPYVLSGVSSYTFQAADSARFVEHAPQDTVPVTGLCLPSPANLNNLQFATVYVNLSPQSDILQACSSTGGGYQFIGGTPGLATPTATVTIPPLTRWQITASTADSTWRLVATLVGFNGIQGTDSNAMSAGSVAPGAGNTLCTDANGGATTSSCVANPGEISILTFPTAQSFNTATQYFEIEGSNYDGSLECSTAATCLTRMPRNGTISALTVWLTANIAASSTLTFTFQSCTPSGSPLTCTPTSRSVTCAIAASTNYCTPSGSFSFAAGDLVDYVATSTGSPGTSFQGSVTAVIQ